MCWVAHPAHPHRPSSTCTQTESSINTMLRAGKMASASWIFVECTISSPISFLSSKMGASTYYPTNNLEIPQDSNLSLPVNNATTYQLLRPGTSSHRSRNIYQAPFFVSLLQIWWAIGQAQPLWHRITGWWTFPLSLPCLLPLTSDIPVSIVGCTGYMF